VFHIPDLDGRVGATGRKARARPLIVYSLSEPSTNRRGGSVQYHMLDGNLEFLILVLGEEEGLFHLWCLSDKRRRDLSR
jgi:hypothetical protein